MEYSILGSSGMKISKIGFGAMSLAPENPEAGTILERAVDHGINYFDTADMYQRGLNESLLGRFLKSKRRELILGTKVGNRWRQDGSGWDWVPSKKYILDNVEDSLRRLQTDYIDLYQLHGGTLEDPIDEIIDAFEMLKEQGKIRWYGISSIRPNVIREYVRRSSIVSVMMQYSLLDRRPEEEMLNYLHENKIGVLVRGAVAKGLLISKPAEKYLDYSVEQVQEISKTLVTLFGNSTQITPGIAAIRFVLEHPAVNSAVVGVRTMEHLKTAISAGSLTRIDQNLLDKLKTVLPVNRYNEHR
jgi:aryl-alcohol dehydrogenase-like predicted oxidoreductase